MPIADNQKFTAEVQLNGTVSAAGGQVRHTLAIFRYRRGNGSPPVSKVNIAAAVAAKLKGPWLALLNEDYTLDSVGVRIMEDPSDDWYLATGAGFTGPGLIAGDRLPPQDVAFLLLKTGFRGKHYRGAKFISPMSESDTTDATADLWNAACLARLNTLAAAIDDSVIDADTNTWSPIVCQHSLIDDSVIPWIIPFAVITNVKVKQSISHLKTRANKVSVY